MVAQAHPDHASLEDEPDAAAAGLNFARQTLLDPERRANVLLDLLGGPGQAADKSLPAGFLMEFMERREAAEAARDAGDRDSLSAHLASARAERERLLADVAARFGEAPSRPEARTEIRRTLNALRYFERLLEQLGPGSENPR